MSAVSMYRDKRTKIYQLNWTDENGTRNRESTKTKERDQAEILRSKKSTDLFDGLTNRKNKPFGEFVEQDFMPFCKPPTLKQSTYETYTLFAEITTKHFGPMSLREITTGDIQSYLDGVKNTPKARVKCKTCADGKAHQDGEKCKRAISPATLNRFRSFLSSVFREALKRKYVMENPVKDTAKLPEDNVRVRCLSDVEEKRLVNMAEPWLRPIIEFALATGMRRGEIMGLTWDDIDLETKRVRVQHTKTNRSRYVRLRKPALAILEAQEHQVHDGAMVPWIFASTATGKPYSKAELRHGMERAIRRAGIRDLKGMHDLRHTLATRLYRETHDLQSVMKVLGHSVITTSARYAHVFQSDADAAMDSLDGVSISSARRVAEGGK